MTKKTSRKLSDALRPALDRLAEKSNAAMERIDDETWSVLMAEDREAEATAAKATAAEAKPTTKLAKPATKAKPAKPSGR